MRIVTASDDFKTFKIKHVLPNSPASEAGLQKDDVILKINNTPVSNMKLNRIWEMFQEKPNKKYKLEIQRGDSKMIKKIKLRKLI
jgi:C-terminal processing protease CtpA/Prc